MNKKLIYRLAIISFLIALGAAIFFLQLGLDFQEKQREQKREKVVYIPSSKYAKYFSLGYDNFIADYLYLWSIQFFSYKSETYRFAVIDEVFDFITEMDPRYVECYRIGALIMIKDIAERLHDPKGYDMAFALLDKGIKNNPDSWILPFSAASYYQFSLNDYKKAFYYYDLALKTKDLPEFYRKRFTRDRIHQLQKFDKKEALKEWFVLWKTTDDEVTRNIAYSKFYDLKIELDIEFIEKAIKRFEEKFNSRPGRLIDLIRHRIVTSLPLDPNGLPYKYDSMTGEVSSPKGYSIRRKQLKSDNS